MTNGSEERVTNHEEKPSLLQEMLGRVEPRIAIKTGIAASLSLFLGVTVARLMDRPNSLLSGTWCVLSTFVVLQAHLGGTYRAAVIRFLGVLIGSVMGAFFTSILGSNSLILGISVTLTILICSLFNLRDSIRIACLSVAVVNILWGLNPAVSPWEFGFYRFIDSALGILIAVFVAHAIWPSHAAEKLRQMMSKTLRMENRLMQLFLSKPPPKEIYEKKERRLHQSIYQLITQNRSIFSETHLELLTKTKNLSDWSNLIDHLDNIYDSVCQLSGYHSHQLGKILDKRLNKRLEETVHQISLGFKHVADMLRTEETRKRLIDLRETMEDLNEELARFRTTRTTRAFDHHEVERFFVFFYNLRSIIEELLKIHEIAKTLNEE